MNKNKPSALNTSKHQKIETVNAVYEALGILNRRAKEARECWSESWKTTNRFTTHTITMVNNSHKYTGVGVALIVGSSQQ